MAWPEAFKQSIHHTFPQTADDFLAALNNSATTAVRLNPFKPIAPDFIKTAKTIDWCNQAFYLNNRPSFTADPLFHGGAYYVQESSSMFLDFILRKITAQNHIQTALDLCAAPGGKTTIMQSVLPETCLITANEIIKSRVAPLVQNVQKWGKANVVITNNDSNDFEQFENYYDLVLTDAPCSGEGLFRRNSQAAEEWSEDNVKLCVLRQKRILHTAAKVTKPGGFLIYATCTFNTLENEEQVNFLRLNYGFKLVMFSINNSWNITELEKGCYRFLPHKTFGEGLFMAVLQKPASDNVQQNKNKLFNMQLGQTNMLAQWINHADDFMVIKKQQQFYAILKQHALMYNTIAQRLNIIYFGLLMGEADKKGALIPDHALALSVYCSSNLPRVELDLNNALLYLRKQNLTINKLPYNGFAIVTYKNLPLGFIKVLQNRINNYLPLAWRIIKNIALNEVS